MSYQSDFEQIEQKLEQPELKTTEKVLAEADSSMPELNQKMIQEKNGLMSGSRSGITGEFGKPLLTDLAGIQKDDNLAYGQCWVFNERDDKQPDAEATETGRLSKLLADKPVAHNEAAESEIHAASPPC